MATIPIWPGSSSFFPGDTPYGFYDNDYDYQWDIENFALWASRRLGYPITDIELQDINFYAAYEEAVNEYGAQVNTQVSSDNMLYLLGVNTGSVNLAGQYVKPSTSPLFKLSKEYGTAVGVGGNTTYYTGSIQLVENKQVYDLNNEPTMQLESGSAGDSITVRKLHHYPIPAMMRYMDPYAGTGVGTQGLLDQFGWGQFMPAVSYVLHPLNYDLLKVQAIELSNQVRKSAYSFQLINNRLRIFPVPQRSRKLFFEYTLDSEDDDPLAGGTGKISDHSNVPYQNLTYGRINQMGRQWIRLYALAICKEMLGYVRNKFSSIPIPNSEVTLNGDDLINAAQEEKQDLLDRLREDLLKFSRRESLERKVAEAEAIEAQFQRIPTGFFIK